MYRLGILLVILLGFVEAQAQQRVIIVDGKRVVLNYDEPNRTYPYEVELTDTEGKALSSAKLLKTGKPTVLLFWMTTCIPCQYELAAIHKKYDGWQKQADFNFYAISMDFPKNEGSFRRRVQKDGWEFEAYHDKKRAFRELMPGGLNGLPQVFLLDDQGEIFYHKRKYGAGDEDILFEKILDLQ